MNTFMRKLLLNVKYSLDLSNNDKHILGCDITGKPTTARDIIMIDMPILIIGNFTYFTLTDLFYP